MEHADAQAKISKLIDGFFSAFDNRNGITPDLTTLLGYFTENAVIARAVGAKIQLYSAQEFARPRIQLLTGGALVDFHESEIAGTTNVFGIIASHTSRYRKTGLLNNRPYTGVGTKSFQLVAHEAGWRILSLAWVDDDD